MAGSENQGPVIPVIFWPGSGSLPSGKTPLGIFDDDDDFIDEAPKIAKWVCHSLGYPVMQVELTDEMIYSQLEQSITEFGSLVNEFNLREYMLSLQGTSTASSATGMLIKSAPLPYIVELSQAYGTEAGTNGNIEVRRGHVTLTQGQQNYDLQSLWSSVSESGNRMEIRRIWHDRSPAIRRFFDPFAGSAGAGLGIDNLLGEFGWGNYSIATQYLLMPIYETLLRAQAIEFNDQIRRSQFSFELHNNNLRVFPVPDDVQDGMNLWFEYVITKDKFASVFGAPGYVSGSSSVSTQGGVTSDYANAPYTDIPYSSINDVGKSWIRKYCLALCKIMLGNIRNKYNSIPIPNAEVAMNGNELISQGTQELQDLHQSLRETLNETGKRSQMQRTQEIEQNVTEILKHVPNLVYIG